MNRYATEDSSIFHEVLVRNPGGMKREALSWIARLAVSALAALFALSWLWCAYGLELPAAEVLCCAG